MKLPRSLSVALAGLASAAAIASAQEGAPPNPVADEVLHRLVGQWRMHGQVMGDSVTYDLHVRRVLMGRFVELSMRDANVPPEYEASVTLGADTTAAPRVIVHWMDSFGAAYSVPAGFGTAVGDTIAFTIDYSTGRFRDVLTANADGTWRLVIDAQDASGWRNFADYRIVPVRPRPMPAPEPPLAPRDSLAPDVLPRMIASGSLQRQLQESASQLLSADESLGGRQLPLRLSVLVRADGSVGDIRVLQSSGYPAADAEALRIMRRMRFTPALKNGQPIDARVIQPIRFVFEE